MLNGNINPEQSRWLEAMDLFLYRSFMSMQIIFGHLQESNPVSSYQTLVLQYNLKEQYIKLLKLLYVCISLSPTEYFTELKCQ